MEQVDQVVNELSNNPWVAQALDMGLVLLKIIFSVVLLYIVKKVVERLIVNYFDHSEKFHFNFSRKNTLKNLSINILQYVYYFILIYTVLSLLGIPVGTLVAGAGIIGLAVSFGAKDLIADFVNGFFILLEDQYDVGDEVNFNQEVEGEVIDIGIRTTVVRSYDGTTNYLSNGDINLVSNYSKHEYRIPFTFLIYPDTDTHELGLLLEKSFEEINEEDQRVNRMQNVGLMRDGLGRLVYEVRIWADSHEDEVAVHGDYYKYFYKQINEAGISLPAGNITAVRMSGE